MLPPPAARKRGWVPSSSVPSEAEVVPASPTGFLDTSPRYSDVYDMVDKPNSTDDTDLGERPIHVPPLRAFVCPLQRVLFAPR